MASIRIHTVAHSTPRVQSQTSFLLSLLPWESRPVPRLRPSVCWQTPVCIQFTSLGTPDPPVSLLLTGWFRCPTDITNVRYPKPGPHPLLTPNVLLQKLSLVQEEAAPFSQLLRPSPLTPPLSYPMSSLIMLASHSSTTTPGVWRGSYRPLCSLAPLQFTVGTAAPLHSAFLITWNTVCLFLTYPAYILPNRRNAPWKQDFLSRSFPAVSQHLEQGPAHLPSDSTTMCVCGSSPPADNFLSLLGTFSNVLEGCSGWKYSELTPTSFSQWDLGYKYFCSLTLPMKYPWGSCSTALPRVCLWDEAPSAHNSS